MNLKNFLFICFSLLSLASCSDGDSWTDTGSNAIPPQLNVKTKY